MGKYDQITSVCDGILDTIHKLAAETLEELNEETHKACKNAYAEFGTYQQTRVTDIFNNAVDAFYSSYTPKEYERTYGLYNVLDIKKDDSGRVILDDPDYMTLFDRTKLHNDRSGNSLFDKVFMEGFHGGAESIAAGKSEIWGVHPAVGTPYYRRGGWVKYSNVTKKKWHKYGKWGVKAVKTESPYNMVISDLDKSVQSDMINAFKEISQKHNDEAVARVQQILAKKYHEIFG